MASSKVEEESGGQDSVVAPLRAHRCSCEIGSSWFRRAVEARNGDTGERMVLLATGAMNPVHKAHINMFVVAKEKLEALGKVVVAGIFSPSHDQYVQSKVRSGPQSYRYMWACERVRFVSLALKESGHSSWITPGMWECSQGRFVDFPQVSTHYAKCLARHFPRTRITLAFLCGTDHVRKCRLHRGVTSQVPVVGIARKQHALTIDPPIAKGRYLFLDDSHALDVSSTAVRKALASGEEGEAELKRMMHTTVLESLHKVRSVVERYSDSAAKRELGAACKQIRAEWEK